MLGRISFVTLGCAKNEVDSEHMQRKLVNAGYEIVSNDEPCEVVVVNTCSFIQPAIEESLDVIFEIAGEEAVIDGDTKLVVCGCLPSRYGESLQDELTEPDLLLTCANEKNIVEEVNKLLGVKSIPCSLPVRCSEGPSSYLKISDGCSRKCSYCTIPFIRGKYHSFDKEELIEEVDFLVSTGVKEVVLIAQDSGIWGLDLGKGNTLATLLDSFASKHPDIWFRVMYLQPSGLTDELLAVYSKHDNICNYFDIPLQHANSTILKSMNRTGSGTEFLQKLDHVREVLPDVTLRTTLIVGYPGETEEQFDELCDFISEADFDYVGIFPYSPEEGTVAAELPNQIDEDIKMERLQILRDLADAVSTNKISSRIGSTIPVLVLGEEEDGQLYGRAQSQSPDVDGIVYLDEGEIGEIAPYTIEDTLLYVMEASRVN